MGHEAHVLARRPLDALFRSGCRPDRWVRYLERPGQDRHALVVVVLRVPLEGTLLGPRFDDQVVRLVVALPFLLDGNVVGVQVLRGAAYEARDQPTMTQVVV